jgi:hypothetical protein
MQANIMTELMERIKAPIPPFWAGVRVLFLTIALASLVAKGACIHYGMPELAEIAQEGINLSLFGVLLATLTKKPSEDEPEPPSV